MTEEINPYAAPQTEPVRMPKINDGRGGRRRNFALAFAVIILIGSPIASAVAVLYDIESIVVSGPILFVVALSLVALAIRTDLRMLIVLSGVSIAMALGCFFTIYVNAWSPSDAQKPIGRATVVFAFLVQAGWLPVRSITQDRFMAEEL